MAPTTAHTRRNCPITGRNFPLEANRFRPCGNVIEVIPRDDVIPHTEPFRVGFNGGVRGTRKIFLFEIPTNGGVGTLSVPRRKGMQSVYGVCELLGWCNGGVHNKTKVIRPCRNARKTFNERSCFLKCFCSWEFFVFRLTRGDTRVRALENL